MTYLNRNLGAGRFRLGWILIVIAAINGLGWTLFRWNYENNLRQVQLTVDYDDTRTMADAYQIPHAQLLKELTDRGVTSIGLSNLSLSSFRDNGRLAITPREQAERDFPNLPWRAYSPAYRYIITATRENQPLLNGQILNHLKAQSQEIIPPLTVQLGQGETGILLPRSAQLFSDAQMGFDPAQINTARKAGLSITARVSNALNFNQKRLDSLIADIKTTGARVVIFSDEEVLGYDSLYKEVAKRMKENNLLFGNIEFTKQRGWQDFAKLTEGQLVRVHSVGGDEAVKAKKELLIDRYARAIKERDIRVAYIRLMKQAKGEYVVDPETKQVKEDTSALQMNLDFIKAINDEIKAQPVPAFLRPPMETSAAKEFGDYPNSILQPKFGESNTKLIRYLCAFLSGLGAIGGTLLLLNLFFDLTARAQRLWFLAGLLIVGVLATSPGMGAKLIALQIGIIFSVIGIMWGGLPQLWDASRKRGEAGRPDDESSAGRAFWKGLAILVKTTLITFIGPLLIVALLNQWKFFSGTDKYLLPKATQLLPLLLVGLAFAGEVFPHRVAEEGAAAARRRGSNRFRAIMNRPFTIQVAITGLILAMAGMIWIARTGNDSGMEISAFELKMRATLESLFITRPRTKEIFAGMPAMIFAVYFSLRRRWLLAAGATIIATIGQADLLNTFCHIHTPFFYSLLRSIHGVWLGALIGGIALAVYVLIERVIIALLPPKPPTPLQPAYAAGSEASTTPNSTEPGVVGEEGKPLFSYDDSGRLRKR